MDILYKIHFVSKEFVFSPGSLDMIKDLKFQGAKLESLMYD